MQGRTQTRKPRNTSSSFQPQQIVSQQQPDPRGDERAQERQRDSFEGDRIFFKIPETVHPIARLREVRPVTAARKEPVVRSVAEQKSGEGPLHGEDDAQKNQRNHPRQQPVSPPSTAAYRGPRG